MLIVILFLYIMAKKHLKKTSNILQLKHISIKTKEMTASTFV
jgi:hypothetical protein